VDQYASAANDTADTHHVPSEDVMLLLMPTPTSPKLVASLELLLPALSIIFVFASVQLDTLESFATSLQTPILAQKIAGRLHIPIALLNSDVSARRDTLEISPLPTHPSSVSQFLHQPAHVQLSNVMPTKFAW
jgi:hypothetical protein